MFTMDQVHTIRELYYNQGLTCKFRKNGTSVRYCSQVLGINQQIHNDP